MYLAGNSLDFLLQRECEWVQEAEVARLLRGTNDSLAQHGRTTAQKQTQSQSGVFEKLWWYELKRYGVMRTDVPTAFGPVSAHHGVKGTSLQRPTANNPVVSM